MGDTTPTINVEIQHVEKSAEGDKAEAKENNYILLNRSLTSSEVNAQMKYIKTGLEKKIIRGKSKKNCKEIQKKFINLDSLNDPSKLMELYDKYCFYEEWQIAWNLALLKRKLINFQGIFEYYQYLLIETYGKKEKNKNKTWWWVAGIAEVLGTGLLLLLSSVLSLISGDIAVASVRGLAKIISKKSSQPLRSTVEQIISLCESKNFLIIVGSLCFIAFYILLYMKIRERRKYKETWVRHTVHFASLYNAMILFLNDGVAPDDAENALDFLKTVSSILDGNIEKFKSNMDKEKIVSKRKKEK